MSDVELRRAVGAIKHSGREVELLVEIIEGGNYTLADVTRIRDALDRSLEANTAQHPAWVRTPVASRGSRVQHSWVEQGERSVFRSSCDLIMTATAHELVLEHRQPPRFLRKCERCRRRSRKIIKIGELYRRTGQTL